MVKLLKQRLDKLDATYLVALGLATLITMAMSWFMISSGFYMIVQEALYPYSNYPVVFFSAGNISMIPIWFSMCLATFMGINEVALTLLKKPLLAKIKMKLVTGIAIMIVVSGVTVAVDYIVWQVAARSNGYTQCPSGTLLLGHKTSSAWAKDEALCYSKEVKYLLPTGTHQQVVEVAEYLNKKH